MKKLILIILFVIIICILYVSLFINRYYESDVFEDKYMYLKEDSTLFSGSLKFRNEKVTCSLNFCDGIPCKNWQEYTNNSYEIISEGEYLNSNNFLSQHTINLLKRESFFINYWKEGDAKNRLIINILKDSSFFVSKNFKNNSDISNIARSVYSDSNDLDYKYLTIAYINSVFNYTLYFKIEFIIVGGELIENGIVFKELNSG